MIEYYWPLYVILTLVILYEMIALATNHRTFTRIIRRSIITYPTLRWIYLGVSIILILHLLFGLW